MTRARVLFVSLFLAVTLLAQNHTTTLPSIGMSIGTSIGTTGWFGWRVPIRGHSICCNRCSLDSDRGFSINDDEDFSISSEMLIAVRVEGGKIRKLRLFDGSCKV